MATIETVNIEDVYPFELNGTAMNPRDTSTKECQAYIAELAEQFKNNPFDPGCPYSQPILWRDGSIYYIIDGECRWRAMKQIGTKRFQAIVYDNLEDAEMARKMAAMGMVATDTKKPLTAVEKSRGVQTTLDMELPEEAIASIAKTDIAGLRKMRKARKVVDDAAEDMSIPRLIAIEEFADDPEAVEKLTNCKESEFPAIAKKIRERRMKEAAASKLAKDLEAHGIKIVEEAPGMALVSNINRLGMLPKELPDGCVAMRHNIPGFFMIFAPVTDEEPPEAQDEIQAEDAAMNALYSDGVTKRKNWLAVQLEAQNALPNLSRLVEKDEERHTPWVKHFMEDTDMKHLVVGPSEIIVFFVRASIRGRSFSPSAVESLRTRACQAYIDLMDAMEADGYEPDEDEQLIYQKATDYMEETK